MYTHILLTTDGSELSQRAALYGVNFAKSVNAQVTVLSVTAPWQTIAIGEIAVAVPEADYEARAEANALGFLKPIADAAAAAGVACKTIHVRNGNPSEAIIETANTEGCDLIVMGSHGRSGLTKLLLGSETVRVLTHSKLPVLVYRE